MAISHNHDLSSLSQALKPSKDWIAVQPISSISCVSRLQSSSSRYPLSPLLMPSSSNTLSDETTDLLFIPASPSDSITEWQFGRISVKQLIQSLEGHDNAQSIRRHQASPDNARLEL
eukprot:scpid80401/ scgid31375/ 